MSASKTRSERSLRILDPRADVVPIARSGQIRTCTGARFVAAANMSLCNSITVIDAGAKFLTVRHLTSACAADGYRNGAAGIGVFALPSPTGSLRFLTVRDLVFVAIARKKKMT